jgi:hypothetical protein
MVSLPPAGKGRRVATTRTLSILGILLTAISFAAGLAHVAR